MNQFLKSENDKISDNYVSDCYKTFVDKNEERLDNDFAEACNLSDFYSIDLHFSPPPTRPTACPTQTRNHPSPTRVCRRWHKRATARIQASQPTLRLL